MKLKFKSLFLALLFVLTCGTAPLFSQVTIGSNAQPVKAALLDIKEKESPTGDETATTGGLVLPRVKLEKKYQLYPFIREAGYPTTDPDSDLLYAAEKPKHKGLIVYNLVENDDEELCMGLNQWDGKEWNCFQQKMGNAIGHITDCNTISFAGQYKDKVALTSANYMKMTVKITKAGAYTITARAAYAADNSIDNGYYFTTTGVYLTTGTYEIMIPGAGTPLKFTPTGLQGDKISIYMNGKEMTLSDGTTTCPQFINVEDSSVKPIYSMNCSRTVVNGVYQLDKELKNTGGVDDNYISVTLNVDPAALGATYLIQTNTVDGIYFKGQGLLSTAGEFTVKLQGYGTPNSYDNKEFIITSNSVSTTATCKATVIVSFATKVTYGWGYYNNSAGYIMQPGSGTRLIADADINFGTNVNSKVKIVKHSPTQTFNHSILSGEGMSGAAYDATKVKEMFDKKPEIILVGFDLAIASGSRATIAGYMVDYLKKGGVLILNLERDYMAVSFFQALYPGITVSTSWLTASRYQMGFMNDEILNGPFGDIRGLFWGNDTLGAISITGLPEEDLVVYSRDSSGKPFMFKHKFYNLFFIGEGGVFANLGGTSGSGAGTSLTTSYPLAFDTDFTPMTRSNWSGGAVENGRLFGNIMAWAVRQAQFNGINSSK